eukprot:TRINITY_DN76438_c0_g1_i2.p1 TRINITY_DN76438_c0_g1~~TRINITY_DN76438_c0_g1_i2.p1  ORF type:complete len:126 (-),score=23.61 TRINITY_DN76438_c0_g1_i2:13-390(-)
MWNKVVEQWWAYQTNITEEQEQASVDAELHTDLWSQNMSRLAAQFNTTDFPDSMQRQFAFIQDIGTAALEDTSKLEQVRCVHVPVNAIGSVSLCSGSTAVVFTHVYAGTHKHEEYDVCDKSKFSL